PALARLQSAVPSDATNCTEYAWPGTRRPSKRVIFWFGHPMKGRTAARGGGGLAQPQPAVAGDGAARPTSELKSATAASPGILLLCIRMSSASASSIPSGGRQMHVPRRSRTRGNLRAVRRQAAAACPEWHSRGTGWHRSVPLPAHPRAQSDADGESRACRVPLETGVTAGMEAARHGCSARDAPVAVETIQANGVPVPLDERRAAGRTERGLPLGVVHVSDVAMPHAPGARDAPGTADRRQRGAG